MSFFALVNCIKQTHEPFIFIKLTLKLKGILSLENCNQESINIMIQTSKIFNMIRINVTAQIWFLNELPYPVDIKIIENNFEYPNLNLQSS